MKTAINEVNTLFAHLKNTTKFGFRDDEIDAVAGHWTGFDGQRFLMAAWAADTIAVGTLKGEQLT
ncbi:MAG: hypothetical protein NPINA01_19300 [Nitrospinaceae bacterium]|nr:MAG: hypothetical protein NPINA01_19300 [Nitrospinaceae bacterium]